MKKAITILLTIMIASLVVVLMSSCSKEDSKPKFDESCLGTWNAQILREWTGGSNNYLNTWIITKIDNETLNVSCSGTVVGSSFKMKIDSNGDITIPQYANTGGTFYGDGDFGSNSYRIQMYESDGGQTFHYQIYLYK